VLAAAELEVVVVVVVVPVSSLHAETVTSEPIARRPT